MTGPVREPDGFERHLRPSAAFGPGDPRVEERQLHIVQGAVAPEEIVRLEDEADPPVAQRGAAVRRQPPGIDTLDEDAAGCRAVQEADQVHQAALSGTRRPDHRQGFPVDDLQGDVVQDRDAHVAHPEGPADRVEGDHRVGHSPSLIPRNRGGPASSAWPTTTRSPSESAPSRRATWSALDAPVVTGMARSAPAASCTQTA
jgi:hypothetical protein